MKKKPVAFDNYEVEPSREVWNRIEAKLPVTKKRRRFLLIIPFLIALIAGWMFIVKGPQLRPSPEKRANPVNTERQTAAIPENKNDNADLDGTGNRNKSKVVSEKVAMRKNPAEPVSRKSKSDASNKLFASEERFSTNRNDDQSGPGSQSEKLFLDESLSGLPPLEISLEEATPNAKLSERIIEEKKISALSRWTLFASSGLTFSNSHDNVIEPGESANISTKGVKDLFFNVGVGYDVSQRFRLISGITFVNAGQEESSTTKIYLHGPPGDPNAVYSFASTSGDLSGSGTEFNTAYFGTPDSALFSPYFNLTPNEPAKEVYFTVRQEFSYVQLPVGIVYKPLEKRITPFAGVYFSTGYLIDHSVELNDKRINYEYENGLSQFLLSAGVTAGIEYRLSRFVGINVNGFYQQGLNSVVKSDEWKPYVAGAGLGISYRLMKHN